MDIFLPLEVPLSLFSSLLAQSSLRFKYTFSVILLEEGNKLTANAIEGAFKYAETSGYGTVGMKVTVELEDMENMNQMNKGFFKS